MGKYMRKTKTTCGDVTLMEASQSQSSSLGVRTRAKTLALQSKPDPCYLELRSRQIEKPQFLLKPHQTTGSGFSIGHPNEDFGENNFDTELMPRSTRESTPCSLIRTADMVTVPGSSTKPRRSPALVNQRAQDVLLRNTTPEMEELFARVEQSHQHLFIEKYNFDVVNDMPLPGRYEWVQVMP